MRSEIINVCMFFLWQVIASSSSDSMINLLKNHDFSKGMEFWFPNCCKWRVVTSAIGDKEGMYDKAGGPYAVVYDRTQQWQSLNQDITHKVLPGVEYIVSARVGISGPCDGFTNVVATLRLENGEPQPKYQFIGR